MITPYVTVVIAEPEHRADVRLGGSGHDIPVIGFGEKYGAVVDVQLSTDLLTAAEQAAWLRDLANKLNTLAVEIQFSEARVEAAR